MRGLFTAVLLIVVNVCDSLENNIEFKIGERKIKVPLARPIQVANTKRAHLADLKFSLSKLIDLLPYLGEEVQQTQPERAPNTRPPGGTFPNRFKHEDQLPDLIPPIKSVTAFPNPNKSSGTYDAPLLNVATNEAQYSDPRTIEKADRKPQLVHKKRLQESPAIPYLPGKPPTMSHMIPQRGSNSIQPMSSTETITEIVNSKAILTDPHEPFITPLPVVQIPVVKDDKAEQRPILKTKLYSPPHKTIEKPILLHSFEAQPPVLKINSTPIATLRPISRPHLYQLVKSPPLASLSLFPNRRLHASLMTTLPNTTPVPITTTRLDTPLMSDTSLLGVTSPELDMKSNTVTALTSVTSTEPETSIASDTIHISVTMPELDMALSPVTTTETDLTSVDTTRVPVTPDTGQLVKSLSITGRPLFPATTPQRKSVTPPVLVPFLEPDMTLESAPVSVPVTASSVPFVVTSIRSPLLNSLLPRSKAITKTKLRPRVISPLIANIPLFPQWILHRSKVPDATPVFDIESVSESFTVSEHTPNLVTKPELLTSRGAHTDSILDTTSILVTSIKTETSTESSTSSETVTLPEEDAMSVSGILIKSDSTLVADMTLVPVTLSESMLSRTPVPDTSAETNPAPVLDRTPMAVTSPEPDPIPASVQVPSVVTNIVSPVSNTSHKRVISPLLAHIPLFPEWRLNKFRYDGSNASPVLETVPDSDSFTESDQTLESETITVSVTPLEPETIPVPVKSLKPDTMPVSDIPPVSVAPLKLHSIIMTATAPFSTTSQRQSTKQSTAYLMEELTSYSNAEPDVMTSSYVDTTFISEKDTTKESNTTPLSRKHIIVPTFLPVAALTQESTKMSESVTSKETKLVPPVTLPTTGMKSMFLDEASSSILYHVTDKMLVPGKYEDLIMTSPADTTYEAPATDERNIILGSDINSIIGTDAATVSKGNRAQPSPEPEPLLPELNKPLVPNTTVKRLTSSLLFETAIASMTPYLIRNQKIPDSSSAELETTVSTSTTTSTTDPSTTNSVTNDARSVDKVSSLAGLKVSTQIRPTKAPCVKRRSSKKKGRLGKRCRKSRSEARQVPRRSGPRRVAAVAAAP